MNARRAFTLVEVIVAMALSLVVMGVCTSIMINTLVEGRRTRAHAEMARDGSFTEQLFTQELRQTGLGVPNGTHINSTYGTTANTSFYASLLVAGTDQIGIVGDLARPDSNFSAYGPLHNRTVGSGNVAWHTENNGGCVPDGAGGGSCTTGTTSVFFPGENGCDASGTGDFNDRTCPWGLRRVLPGDRLIIVAGNGSWTHAAFPATGTIDQSGVGLVFAARLASAYAPADWPDPASPALPVTAPNEVAGQGWVSTLDRVFFRYNSTDRTIERRHCRGDPDPDNNGWPGPSATTIPANPVITPPGGAANVCGPFEPIARNVERLTFSYFDGAGVAVALRNTGPLKRSVRRVGYRIEFRQTLDGRDVTYDVAGSVRLQNL